MTANDTPTQDAQLAFDPNWVLHGQQELCAGRLLVRHKTQTPHEIEPTLTKHLLIAPLTEGSRQVYKFCGAEHDGVFPVGSFWLLPAGEPGFFRWGSSTDELVSFIIEPKLLAKTALELECPNFDRLELQPIVLQADPTLHALALQFKQEIHNNTLGGECYSESLANLFNIHLLRHYCTSTPILRSYNGGLSSRRLQQTIDYIQAHLDTKLSLDTLATELNLSVYHFCELFTRSMGIPPYKYVLQQRVERAKQLLNRSAQSIGDIALDCGFANQSHLNRHFIKLAGISPKKYRDLPVGNTSRTTN
jgi:AraC family transcriptional regulator